MSTVAGIDVSNNNGAINWPAMKAAGVRFAFLKATEGTGYRDTWYASNRQGANAAGITIGAYHFAHPYSHGRTEADYFLNFAAVKKGDLLPVLDIESGAGNLRGYVEAFAARVHERLGVWPLVYSTGYFLDSHVGARVGGCELWIAHWDVAKPRMPKGWPAWRVWQDGLRTVGGRRLDHDVATVPLPIYEASEEPAPDPSPYPPAYKALRKDAIALRRTYVKLDAKWRENARQYIERWITEGR